MGANLLKDLAFTLDEKNPIFLLSQMRKLPRIGKQNEQPRYELNYPLNAKKLTKHQNDIKYEK